MYKSERLHACMSYRISANRRRSFIYFVGQFGAATIRGRRLFEGGVYSRAAFILLGNMTRAAPPTAPSRSSVNKQVKPFEKVWLLQKPVEK